MRRLLRLTLFATVVALATECSRGREAHHAGETRSAEPPPPTPDTTPIAVLRTPAGLVLGVEGTPAPVHTTPTPTPAAAP
jgi:hypothetical protein